MQFVEGIDLARRIEERGPLTTGEMLPITRAIAAALDHAHARGVVHRDIKPANIMLPSSGEPAAIVTDFGIARAVDTSHRMTGTGQFIGSLAYVSPEQIDGQPVDSRADVYSFACTVFEMLSGRKLFNAPTPSGIIAAHFSDRPFGTALSAAGVPVAAQQVLQWGLAPTPSERPQTATEFVDALSRSLQSAGGSARSAASDLSADTTTVAAAPSRRDTRSVAPTRDMSPDAAAGMNPGLNPGMTPAMGPAAPPPMAFANGAPRRGSRTPLVAAAVAAALFVTGGAAVVLGQVLGHSGQAAADTTSSSTSDLGIYQGSEPVGTDPYSPDSMTQSSSPRAAVAAPVQSSTSSSSTTPSSTSTSTTIQTTGDLGLSTPISTPACDGRGVVILYSAVTNSVASQRSQVQTALARWPGSSYMKPSPDCTSIRNVKDGKQIYAVYMDLGSVSEQQLCDAVLPYADSTAGSPYGKFLDTAHPIGHFYRWTATMDHCMYWDKSGGSSRQIE